MRLCGLTFNQLFPAQCVVMTRLYRYLATWQRPLSTRVIIAILINVNVFNFIYRTRRNAGSGDHFTRETRSA